MAASNSSSSLEMSALVSSTGQITLPAEVCRALALEAGDTVVFEPIEGGFRLSAARSAFASVTGAAGVGCAAAIAFGRELRGIE